MPFVPPIALASETVLLLGVAVIFVLGACSFVVKVAMIQGTGRRPQGETGEQVSCPSCGARVKATADRCGYCDEPLEPADPE
jgi:hypothetical protein